MNADGLMVDDGNVYKLADDRYWVMINTAGLEDWFRETAEGLDATVEHRTDDYAMIAVQGPTSQTTLQGLTERDLGELWVLPVLARADHGRGRAGLGAAHGVQR